MTDGELKSIYEQAMGLTVERWRIVEPGRVELSEANVKITLEQAGDFMTSKTESENG